MPVNKGEKPNYRTSSANRSDPSMVVTVADLINMAMGPTEINTVNYKMIQTILHILARNMRLLDQQVELRSSDETSPHLSTKPEDYEKQIEVYNIELKEKMAKIRAVYLRGKATKEKKNSDKEKDRANEEKAKIYAIDGDKAERDKKKQSEQSEKEIDVDSDMELEKNFLNLAKIRAAYLPEKDEERAKIADINAKERKKYLKEKDEIKKAKKIEKPKKEMAKTAKVNDEERKKYLKGEREREEAKLDAMDSDRTESEKEKESEQSDTETDDYELESVDIDSDIELEKKLTKLALIREVYLREKEIERLAGLSAEEGEKYLKEKDEIRKAKERQKYEKEMANLAKMNDGERKKYLEDKEERQKAMLYAKEREKAERYLKRDRKLDEKEMTKLAKMNDEERDKYLIDKDERKKAIEREKLEKEMAKLVTMSDEEREKYLKDKKEREKAIFDAKEKNRADREQDKKAKEIFPQMSENEREKYLKQNKKDDIQKAEFDAKDMEKADRDNEKERTRYEKEMEILANMTDEEKDKHFKGNAERDEKEKAKLEDMTDIEGVKYLKDKAKRDMDKKEKEKFANMADKDREKYLKDKAERDMDEKEKAKLANMANKDREKYLKDKAERDTDEQEPAKLANMADKDREKYLKEKAERDTDEKEKAKLATITDDKTEKYLKDTEVGDMDEKEKSKLAEMADEKTEKYLKDTEEGDMYEKETAKLAKKADGVLTTTTTTTATTTTTTTTTRGVDGRNRVGSIEVVRRSEFELLEAKVKELEQKTIPIPYPSMPDNAKLRTELASGSASLTDTMQAMQVSARVQATETAMDRMANLLTQLAAAGALPKDVVKRVGEVTAGMGRGTTGETRGGVDAVSRGTITSHRDGVVGRSVSTLTKGGAEGSRFRTMFSGIDEDDDGESRRNIGTSPRGGDEGFRVRTMFSGIDEDDDGESRRSIGTLPSAGVLASRKNSGITTASKAHFIKTCVTRTELDDAQRDLKDSMIKRANDMVYKAQRLAEIADANVKLVADQMKIATDVAARVDVLFGLVNDYAEQLAGFDAGVSMQFQNFNEQIFQMRCELNDGIALFTQTIANSETEAVKELHKRYEDLVLDLDLTKLTLDKLGIFHNTINDELRSLLNCVESLREEKADRDELLDGIRDKADKLHLDGLIREQEFEEAKKNMEIRLDDCHDKFQKEETVWMTALADLNTFAETKASGMQLNNFKGQIEDELNKIQEEVHLLSVALGEPKAMLLTRKISQGGNCGPCQIAAHQAPTADCAPPLLPAMQKHMLHSLPEKSCPQLVKEPRQQDEREHICNRWVGGSHTLVNKNVVHQDLGVIQMYMPPTKKYGCLGNDGKVYQLEKALEPCVDCNQLVTEEETEVKENGAGEPGVKKANLKRPLHKRT